MENENKVVPEVTNEEIGEKTTPEDVVMAENVVSEDVEDEGTSAENRCFNCQALLVDGQAFCPECGTSQKKICSRCGAELEDGQAFCPSCGQKIADITVSANADISQFNADINKQKNKKKILTIILAALVVCAVAVYLIFTIFLNPQHYIEKGNYQTAYKVASGSEKEDVLRENIIAVVSADCINSLKDSSSFELRDAWIQVNDSSKIIILQVAANNSYGNTVVNYWYYSYDNEEKEYSLLTTFSDFSEEKTYSWDNSSEEIEKLLKNIAKATAKIVMSDGIKIKDDSIDTINQLFKNNILEDVTLINAEPQKTE